MLIKQKLVGKKGIFKSVKDDHFNHAFLKRIMT